MCSQVEETPLHFISMGGASDICFPSPCHKYHYRAGRSCFMNLLFDLLHNTIGNTCILLINDQVDQPREVAGVPNG